MTALGLQEPEVVLQEVHHAHSVLDLIAFELAVKCVRDPEVHRRQGYRSMLVKTGERDDRLARFRFRKLRGSCHFRHISRLSLVEPVPSRRAERQPIYVYRLIEIPEERKHAMMRSTATFRRRVARVCLELWGMKR